MGACGSRKEKAPEVLKQEPEQPHTSRREQFIIDLKKDIERNKQEIKALEKELDYIHEVSCAILQNILNSKLSKKELHENRVNSAKAILQKDKVIKNQIQDKLNESARLERVLADQQRGVRIHIQNPHEEDHLKDLQNDRNIQQKNHQRRVEEQKLKFHEMRMRDKEKDGNFDEDDHVDKLVNDMQRDMIAGL